MGTSVGTEWKTSLNVGALVTLVAAVHYFYMREFWIIIGTSPILYRYIDWSITVPLQMVEFYFILSAVNDKIGSGMFFRLFIGTVMMLAFGYAGESHFLMAWPAFALGMSGWGFILYEVFAGEAGKEAGNLPSRLLLRLFDLQSLRRRSPEFDLQLGGLCQQDCILPCHLAVRQGRHSHEVEVSVMPE